LTATTRADQERLATLKSEAEAKVAAARTALNRLRAADARVAAAREITSASLVGLGEFPTTDRSVGADTGLTLHAIQVRQIVAARYPSITAVGGFRSGDWGDHGRGLALDVMIPGWTGEGALVGTDMAAWVQANATNLGVDYIIWQQQFWQVGMSRWQMMGDRGSPTQNHMDHVHISLKP
jgi:hypothetical protein